jgi:hypothetical protein
MSDHVGGTSSCSWATHCAALVHMALVTRLVKALRCPRKSQVLGVTQHLRVFEQYISIANILELGFQLVGQQDTTLFSITWPRPLLRQEKCNFNP